MRVANCGARCRRWRRVRCQPRCVVSHTRAQARLGTRQRKAGAATEFKQPRVPGVGRFLARVVLSEAFIPAPHGRRRARELRGAWARNDIPDGGPDGERHPGIWHRLVRTHKWRPAVSHRGPFRVPDYFNIEDDQTAEEFVLATNHGHRRFPVVVIEDRVVINPTVAELRRVLDEHGMRSRIPA